MSDEGQGCQTEFSKYLLSAKIETMMLRNEVNTMKSSEEVIVSSISYQAICNNLSQMKHFAGLTSPQFEALFNFLNNISPLDDITYWNYKESTGLERAKNGPDSRFSAREKLFICLLRLRRGFTIKTMAILLSSPQRRIEETYIRRIFHYLHSTHVQSV